MGPPQNKSTYLPYKEDFRICEIVLRAEYKTGFLGLVMARSTDHPTHIKISENDTPWDRAAAIRKLRAHGIYK